MRSAIVVLVVGVSAPAAADGHHCVRSAWPYYDSSQEETPRPPEPPQAPSDYGEGHSGATLDDKALALAKQRHDEGVCDTRHRDDVEAALGRLTAPKPARSYAGVWDRTSPLQGLDRVRATLALTPAEEKQLAVNGFVVPDRLAYSDYTTAYYDIHRGELPVYVSVDSILHAVFAAHDQLLVGLERDKLGRELDDLLGGMHCGLPAAAKLYPPDVANDLDLYLTVARSLLAGHQVPSELGKIDSRVEPILAAIDAGGAVTRFDLFGRTRAFDPSQFVPRGHYADGADMARYFQATMWVSRTEFNLVSRDSRSSQPGYAPDPTETPREAVVALALADLVERTHGSGHLTTLDDAWTLLAGGREDVSLPELRALRSKAKIGSLHAEDAAAKLRAAIGDTHQRTVNIHPMPTVAHLPAIATLLGPRITPDTVALGALTSNRGADFQPLELGYVLGQDRALAYADPGTEKLLRETRTKLAAAHDGPDLYSAWLRAIRALAIRPEGVQPGYADTPAYSDLRLASTLTAYGQIRHDHVLFDPRVYDQGGCTIPDGYVEPAVATYQALVEYARRGRKAAAKLDPKHTTPAARQFDRLEHVLTALIAMSKQELANQPLSPAAKQFLAMIVEQREATAWGYNGTFPVATWDGWYVDLFPNIDTAFNRAAFVIDIAAFDRNGQSGIDYLGAHGPRLGLFVVDTGGVPRVMVGPVASPFQHTGPLKGTLNDDAADKTPGLAPWGKSYSMAAPPLPPLTIEFQRELPPPTKDDEIGMGPEKRWPRDEKKPLPEDTVRIEATREVGPVTLELLDHHFQRLGQVTVTVHPGRLDTRVAKQKAPIEAIRVIAGPASGRLDLGLDGYGVRDFTK